MSAFKMIFIRVISILSIVVFWACGGGGSGSAVTSSGRLSLSLTDATTSEYKAIYVTIKAVHVHMTGDKNDDSSWETVVSPNKTFNLLELVNGVREQLGIAELQAGRYTQMRLIIGETADDDMNILTESHPYANYIINENNEYKELKIPSGLRTGIKIVQGFDISENQTTELLLDFVASESIVKAGNSGKWLLKPTIKLLNTVEYGIISGSVADSDGNPLEGVWVSAELYDTASSIDEKDRVVVQTSTVTNAAGSYKLFIEPNTYNIVVYNEQYAPDCEKVTAEAASEYSQDFTLSSASSQTVNGQVSISGNNDDDHVTICFRQSTICGGSSEEEEIEVTSFKVADGGSFSILLPHGSYSVIASTSGADTQEIDIIVPKTPENSLNFEFDIE